MTTTRTRKRPPYTRDSLESALVTYGVHYSPPEQDRPTWFITTGTGTHEWRASQVFAFCCGLAMGKVS